MKLSDKEAAVEAILFAAGDPVEIESIAAVIGEDKDTAISLAESLSGKYYSEKRGINIIRLNDSYQMCTDRKYFDYIDRLFRQPKRKKLSQAVLEVLAIIAYKQPITRGAIEEIRGVNADRAVSKLVEFGLVEEKGRLSVPGRPILFGITDEFLKYFGYESCASMPVRPEPDEQLRLEAINEIDGKKA